ncbi:hypothetical protein PSEUDO8BK_60043 [Pseudomonas sp. 8BK]|nr:hypothetical protein PSEUDO8BK_60043 [Pseudomonas sp. 8BK]
MPATAWADSSVKNHLRSKLHLTRHQLRWAANPEGAELSAQLVKDFSLLCFGLSELVNIGNSNSVVIGKVAREHNLK